MAAILKYDPPEGQHDAIPIGMNITWLNDSTDFELTWLVYVFSVWCECSGCFMQLTFLMVR